MLFGTRYFDPKQCQFNSALQSPLFHLILIHQSPTNRPIHPQTADGLKKKKKKKLRLGVTTFKQRVPAVGLTTQGRLQNTSNVLVQYS